LAQVTSFNDPAVLKKSDKHETMILHARPVFVVLNKQILSLFENENVNSLIKSINIKTLSHPAVVVALNKYHCF